MVCAVLAMLITPTVDPVNMLLLMVPLIGLYFLSIITEEGQVINQKFIIKK